VYSTGQGNGPFGLGWSISVPAIARDTEDGVPSYTDGADSFLLSGMDRLVPIDAAAGEIRYAARTEGAFARIVHRIGEGNDYWEVHARDGLVSRYAATVKHPDDPDRIFSWSLSSTEDTFGNRIEYLYERDEAAEDGPHRWDQTRLKTIRYVDYGQREAPSFLVTIDFVYTARPDSFSSYRAGFEIRTTARCSRIEIRTHAGESRLVRVWNLRYADELDRAAPTGNGASLLSRIDVEGADGDAREPLPSLGFEYTQFRPEQRVYGAVTGVGGALPERSLAHGDFELVDLFGSGLPDIVQLGDTQRYWKNLGNVRFDVPRTLQGMEGIRLGDPGVVLADVDGDGHIDVLVSKPGLVGHLPLTAAGATEPRPFVRYDAAPPISLDDPELRLVDLDGDGVIDALRTGSAFELFYHDREHGWTRSELRERDRLDRFPDVYFSDPRVKLADMTGDGLTDIVLIDHDRIDYWPYLGHGRWGARVTMIGRVQFPDATTFGGIGFDPKRVLLGDVDGDGCADLVYVESGRVTLWLNQQGNGWSSPIVVRGTPPITDADAVRLADILGNGSAGILWTYDAGRFFDSSYKFLDLTGGTKPYLLCTRDNGAGGQTRIEYSPSTRYYVEDARDPRTRWRSRLPFPVQVVSRVHAIDQLSRGKLTSEYRYHQGYWDGDDREFRGFGMVEQLDTETFARYHDDDTHAQVDETHFSPPTLLRTWFHQGEVTDHVGSRRESEVIGANDPTMFTPDQRSTLLEIARSAAGLGSVGTLRDALRALRGSVMRTELYALDASPDRERPYTVTESLYDVRKVATGAFFPFLRATRTTQWERGDDPMTRLSFTDAYNAYGLPQQQLDIAVPRGRAPLATLSGASEPYLATCAITEYAGRDDSNRYVVDRVARSTRYEVRNDGRQSALELHASVASGTAELHVIGQTRTFFDGDAFVGLPVGTIGDHGAPTRREELAFADAFLADALAPAYLLPGVVPWGAEYPGGFREATPPLAGYLHVAGTGYFVVAERLRYDFQSGDVSRGVVRERLDALGSSQTIELDEYDLFPTRHIDAVGLVTEAVHDYRVFMPRAITDANGNTVEAAYSPAGMVVAQFVRGKSGEGDTTDPSVRYEYDLRAFEERAQPMSVRSIRRVHHDSETDVPPDERARTIESIEYFDGFGRVLQARAQAEDTLYGDPAFGGSGLPLDPSAPNAPAVGRTAPDHVVVTGSQTYDNKGHVIEKYEPFFSRGWSFSLAGSSEIGQKTTLFYDTRGQLVRTVSPDGSESIVVFGTPIDIADPTAFRPTPWESYAYDANDNAGRTHATTSIGYRSHWNTPTSKTVDGLGRSVATVVRNGSDPTADWFTTRTTYDIRGNLLAVVDPLGREAFRYTYDLLSRRWRSRGIDAGQRDQVLDALGQPIEARDAKGALVLQAFDLLHRQTRMWARDSASSPVQLRQVFGYGDEGPPTERDAARLHNLLGMLVSQHDASGMVRHRAFDFKGNLVEKARRPIADARILEAFANAPSNGWDVTAYSTDWEPPPGQTIADVEQQVLDVQVYETSTTFDALGRSTTVRLPGAVDDRRRVIRATYNSIGGLERVQLDGETYVDRIAYDAGGRRVLIAYGNGIMTRYAYDPRSLRLARMRSERFTRTDDITFAPSGGAHQDCTYDYDLAGNILSMTDRTPSCGVIDNADAAIPGDPALAQLLAAGDAFVRRFTYDPTYRLLTATGRECDQPPDNPPWLDTPRCVDATRTRGYVERYEYNAAGTVTSLAHQNATGGFNRQYEIEPRSNRLVAMQLGSTTSIDYGFDDGGNLISEASSRHFEWTHADQLKAFRTQAAAGAEPSIYAHYLYDASGQRVTKLVRKQGGRVEVTHYIDGTFEHHRWRNGSTAGENNHIHITDGAKRIALVRTGSPAPDDAAPDVQYELADHLGDASVICDSVGGHVNTEEFTPYGETSFGSFAKKRYRFTGRERDEESSLSYHGARYLAPWLARWTSCDPVGPAGGYNLYAYASCNPLRLRDIAGTQPQEGGTEGKVYILIDTSGRKIDQDALATREQEILDAYQADLDRGASVSTGSPETEVCNPPHIYKIQAYDLGKLKDQIDGVVAEAKKYGYGKTVEVSIWGHQGKEHGPRGRDPTSGPYAVDRTQLDPEGWRQIDFNFDPDQSIAAFYGCNSLAFPERFMNQHSDVRFAAAFGVGSYPSYSNTRYVRVDDYEHVQGHYAIYYWGRGHQWEKEEGLTLFARGSEFGGDPQEIHRFGDEPYHWDVSPRPLDPRFFPNMTFDRAQSILQDAAAARHRVLFGP
jgi:RHS repeat-associated protein